MPPNVDDTRRDDGSGGVPQRQHGAGCRSDFGGGAGMHKRGQAETGSRARRSLNGSAIHRACLSSVARRRSTRETARGTVGRAEPSQHHAHCENSRWTARNMEALLEELGSCAELGIAYHKVRKLIGVDVEKKIRKLFPKIMSVMSFMFVSSLQYFLSEPLSLGHDSSKNEWIIKLMPSGPHNVASRELVLRITTQYQNANHSKIMDVCVASGSEMFQLSPTRTKQADESFCSRARPPGSLPVVVIEVGVSEGHTQLVNDAKWWLETGEVNLVIIVVIDKDSPQSVKIELWERLPNPRAQRTISTAHSWIGRQRGPTMDYPRPVQGVPTVALPLVIPYADLGINNLPALLATIFSILFCMQTGVSAPESIRAACTALSVQITCGGPAPQEKKMRGNTCDESHSRWRSTASGSARTSDAPDTMKSGIGANTAHPRVKVSAVVAATAAWCALYKRYMSSSVPKPLPNIMLQPPPVNGTSRMKTTSLVFLRVLTHSMYRYGEYLGYIDVKFDHVGKVVRWTGGPIHLMNQTAQDTVGIWHGCIKMWRMLFDAFGNDLVGNTTVLLDSSPCKTKIDGDLGAPSAQPLPVCTSSGVHILTTAALTMSAAERHTLLPTPISGSLVTHATPTYVEQGVQVGEPWAEFLSKGPYNAKAHADILVAVW
ncbi:hypothetical protein GGX14DRAFT_630120 [Mycena pura]|uniref:Uncharacterized protein n=1 Tax=Mycena pura TaxID=153505 RepID=A0AAD7E4U0_9AGAR|nr:hypothetical protein GGX14DRAFT_630120 [Mycena pura]